MKRKRILIAEDERPIANALNLKLQSEGFDTYIVYNGNEAINALKDSNYDLLLLDLVMPEKNGYFVLEQIRRLNKNISVVIISNLSQAEDKQKTKELGAIDYIVKSDTTLVEIIERIKKVLDR